MSETRTSAGAIIAEHYQKTSELTYTLRQQRDRFFLFLLGALGAATLFNFDATSSNSLLIAAAVKFLEIKDQTIINGLQTSPLLEIIQTLLLVVVFYLMGNLHHRNASVLRNFRYLDAMEQEIRGRLGIKDQEVSFSREGNYYWRARKADRNSNKGFMSQWMKRLQALDLTKNFYTIVLALLLFLSFALRIRNDTLTQNWLLTVIDTLIGIPTAIYWWNYARVSHTMDSSVTKV